jgi:NitT/TauT family transport system permease protein
VLLHRYPVAEVALNPLIVFFQIIPKIALAPIFLLWFGFGLAPKVLLVAIIAFFPVTLNTISGLMATSPDLAYLVQSVGGTRTQHLWRVELPSALPQIFAGLKIAMTFSVIGAVVGEFTGGSEGLGYLILFSSSQVKTPLLFAALLAIALLGLVMYYAIVWLEYWVLPWQRTGGHAADLRIQWQH